jgi:hypothetical protein
VQGDKAALSRYRTYNSICTKQEQGQYFNDLALVLLVVEIKFTLLLDKLPE